MTKNKRLEIFNKFGGKCAYSGTPLEDDWQVDHIIPQNKLHWLQSRVMRDYLKTDITDIDDIANLIPCQRIINHYKRSLDLEDFRKLWLEGLHKRLDKPKNPRTEASRKTKEYRLKVASYFGITPDKPFCGKFYFETITGQGEV
jgi:5-methylcytosine-specific restriction endonuclease McrA